MITKEPVRGSYAYLEHPGLFGLSGLDQFKVFLRQQLPRPPLYHLSGLELSDAGIGTVTFKMPASPWWRSGAGLFLGGVFPFVADVALGGAIYSTLPAGMALTTSQLSMDFLRPATVESGAVIARGKLIQAGPSQGLSEATVEDAHGRLLAHATCRCILTPLPFAPAEPPTSFPSFQEPSDGLDPFRRPPEGEVLPQETWDRNSGLDVIRGWASGDVPPPPVARLLGLRITEVEEGRAAYTMPASEWFCTAYRSFYGGAVALLADCAINGAVTTTIAPRTAYGTLDLKINYLRPIRPDGRDLTARAEVVHRGRTIAVATAEILDADGKLVALASGSNMILPGRSWMPSRPPSPIEEPAPGDEEEAVGDGDG